MLTQSYNYRDKIRKELSLRQKKNAHYSLRAFGRDLGIHPSTLSAVLNGKRELPFKNLKRVIENFDLSPIEETLFRESVSSKNLQIDQIKISEEYSRKFIIDEAYFEIIAEWEHYALLSLIETNDFKYDIARIANRLGITRERVRVIVQKLLAVELVRKEDKTLKLNQARLQTTEDISSRALKLSHKETLEIAAKKLTEIDIELRDFSSMTIAIDLSKLLEAKTVIREFRQKLATLLKGNQQTEVYNIAIQMFPLTQIKSLNKEKRK